MQPVKRTPIVIMYSFLNLSLGVVIAQSLLVLAGLIYTFFTKSSLFLNSFVPVTVELTKDLNNALSHQGLNLPGLKGNLFITPLFNNTQLITYTGIVYNLFWNIFIIVGIQILKKFLFTLTIGTPFTLENAKRLRMLAFMIILVPLLLHIVCRLFINLTIPVTNGYITIKGNWDTFEYIFIGGLVFIISEVFRKGVLLQEENNLTV
ncbi:MAG: DUF2975 domain-containing protein [Ignavibacteriales bacterium]|nr:DUF2975 domain-containing protein [Ignavibacteriales bacterium]